MSGLTACSRHPTLFSGYGLNLKKDALGQIGSIFWFFIKIGSKAIQKKRDAINEQFLPRFLDLVVWGHEHECWIDPKEVPGIGFHLMQLGSSIATTLIDDEAKPKHVLLLEIKGSQCRPTKIPLKSARHFEYQEVVLEDEPNIDPNDQDVVLRHLDKVVKDMIILA